VILDFLSEKIQPHYSAIDSTVQRARARYVPVILELPVYFTPGMFLMGLNGIETDSGQVLWA
jgi:hypothetical protein